MSAKPSWTQDAIGSLRTTFNKVVAEVGLLTSS
jgi:hypothetical protein